MGGDGGARKIRGDDREGWGIGGVVDYQNGKRGWGLKIFSQIVSRKKEKQRGWVKIKERRGWITSGLI